MYQAFNSKWEEEWKAKADQEWTAKAAKAALTDQKQQKKDYVKQCFLQDDPILKPDQINYYFQYNDLERKYNDLERKLEHSGVLDEIFQFAKEKMLKPRTGPITEDYIRQIQALKLPTIHKLVQLSKQVTAAQMSPVSKNCADAEINEPATVRFWIEPTTLTFIEGADQTLRTELDKHYYTMFRPTVPPNKPSWNKPTHYQTAHTLHKALTKQNQTNTTLQETTKQLEKSQATATETKKELEALPDHETLKDAVTDKYIQDVFRHLTDALRRIEAPTPEGGGGDIIDDLASAMQNVSIPDNPLFSQLQACKDKDDEEKRACMTDLLFSEGGGPGTELLQSSCTQLRAWQEQMGRLKKYTGIAAFSEETGKLMATIVTVLESLIGGVSNLQPLQTIKESLTDSKYTTNKAVLDLNTKRTATESNIHQLSGEIQSDEKKQAALAKQLKATQQHIDKLKAELKSG